MINKTKRIGIDARFYGPVGKGLGRYTKEIVDHILTLDSENEYVIYLGRENYDEFKSKNTKVKKVLADVRWYTLSEQILMPYYIWREHLDLMHFPHFNVPIFCPVKFIVTIHDLILTKFPTQRASTLSPLIYKIKNIAYKFIINNAVKGSQKIIAVSDFTKNDILKHFSVPENKIVVTYEGVSDKLKMCSLNGTAILEKYKIEKPFLLYVGNAYPHKNLEGFIKVYSEVVKENSSLSLVLVGKDDYFYNRVKSIAKQFGNGKIIFPGFVPDSELFVFYKEALAYVFPSLYEGFGLPPLEAMIQGCPVLSSNKASMPEILGDAVLYFDPENENETKNSIERIIEDGDLRAELTSRGYEQVKEYNWTTCAKKTLDVYNDVK